MGIGTVTVPLAVPVTAPQAAPGRRRASASASASGSLTGRLSLLRLGGLSLRLRQLKRLSQALLAFAPGLVQVLVVTPRTGRKRWALERYSY
jgi:hypothetical protein